MRKGKFFAYLVEQAVTSIPYREFTYRGVHVGNGTYNDTKDLNFPIIKSGAHFRNRDQVLEMIPTYGKLNFDHVLLKTPSLIESYSFEKEDVYEDIDGTKLLKGWNVNIENFPGVTYGIKETKALEGDWNFYLNTEGSQVAPGVGSSQLQLLSKPVLVEYDDQDLFEFRFKYACIINSLGRLNPKWVRIKWALKVGDYYLINSTGDWDINKVYNDVYAEKFNNDEEFKIVGRFRIQPNKVEELLQVEFLFETDRTLDFEGDYDDLRAVETTELWEGKRIKGKITDGGLTKIMYYILKESSNLEEEQIPNIIEPDDYSGIGNDVRWFLELEGASQESGVTYWYLDNVVFRHLPRGSEPPPNVSLERDNTRYIRVNWNEEFLLNDIDIDNINNSERTYINFFKLLDGTPTQVWERAYRLGQGKLMELAAYEFIAQYQEAANKLTGSLLCLDEIQPSTVLREVNDENRRYMFMGYELHVRPATVVFDMLELRNPLHAGDFNDDFNDDFNAGFSAGFDG